MYLFFYNYNYSPYLHGKNTWIQGILTQLKSITVHQQNVI